MDTMLTSLLFVILLLLARDFFTTGGPDALT